MKHSKTIISAALVLSELDSSYSAKIPDLASRLNIPNQSVRRSLQFLKKAGFVFSYAGAEGPSGKRSRAKGKYAHEFWAIDYETPKPLLLEQSIIAIELHLKTNEPGRDIIEKYF